MLPLLALLSAAPTMLQEGLRIYNAVTGKPASPEAQSKPEALADSIEQLPPAQRDQVYQQLLEARVKLQGFDTQRFLALTDGDAEKIRATARPQIALAAMRVVTLFSQGIRLLVVATVIQWAVLAIWTIVAATGVKTAVPDLPSVWKLLADASPVAEMIWAPLIASFWAAVAIVKKYMAVRERDKAQEYEIRNGSPLNSTQATIEAAGGAVSSLIRAWRSR
jgi:hypothetical protein